MKTLTAASLATFIALAYSQVNMMCVKENCQMEFEACTADAMCGKMVGCEAECLKMVDISPEKLKVQNCTNKCTYTYGDETFVKILTCMATNKCITLPETPNMCKSGNVKFQKNITLADMAGTWWNLRGFNPAYDCYPCSKYTFTSTNFMYSFDAWLVDGGVKPVSFNGTIMSIPGQAGFSVSLPLGIIETGTFWPFDLIEEGGNKYVLVYYCAKESGWNIEGAYVFSMATMISESAMASIRSSFQMNVGISFERFCSPSTTSCSSN